MQNIENSFEVKKKVGAIFVDLTAAYDTVCVALQPHLQAAETSARQAHGWNDHGTCSEQKLYPDHW